MFKRRSHARFVVSNGEGVLRVAHDVTLTSTAAGELVAISLEPQSANDAITIELLVDGQIASVPVRVEEARPRIVDGQIRHEIRLSYLDPTD